MIRRFKLPEPLALKLEATAKRENKTPEALLAEIVAEYIEVQEFLVRKIKQKATKPKAGGSRSD